ncbi:MAG: hypothetical protein CVU77_03230 [Elusimicrobia bacterium HGW-Elusimicrobia-1]|jgi:dihydroflavonol-4-reductase|nr:MAG: hypothetical protein CVU77_03230 [Elusimicrobia bacterium HGW-Elusimicrobia-1]
MKAFVTGAGGFLGRNLVDELLAAGHEVRALTRAGGGLPSAVETIAGDVTDAASLAKAVEGCDVCYHLAALVDFSPSKRNESLDVNVGGTRNVLSAARSAGVKKIVVASSAITLGSSKKPSLIRDETFYPDPSQIRQNPYTESKLAVEEECRKASDSGQNVTVVNPTTVYGRYDRSLNSGAIIMTVRAASVVPAPPGGGNVVDARDVARGMLLAAEKGRSGRRYVLGAHNLLFAEIFAVIARVLGKKPLFVPVPRVARLPAVLAASLVGRLSGNRFLTAHTVGDLFRYKYYSSAAALADLGWIPAYSFQESVRDALAYYERAGITGGKK